MEEKAGLTSRLATTDLANSQQGFKVTGISGDSLGSSVRNIGDINKDDCDDIMIGAYTASPYLLVLLIMELFMLYMVLKPDLLILILVLSASATGYNGFQIIGES